MRHLGAATRFSTEPERAGDVSIVDRVEVPHEPAGVALARAALRERLQRWGVPLDHEVVVLLVSEAVTNAVLHGAPPTALHLEWDGNRLRIAVEDARPTALPLLAPVDRSSPRGRGVFLIDRLADRWGVAVGEEVKTIWFELEPG